MRHTVHVWSVKGKHNVRHMARLVGKGLKNIVQVLIA